MKLSQRQLSRSLYPPDGYPDGHWTIFVSTEPTSTRQSATWRRTFRRPWRRSIGPGTLRPRARFPRMPCSRAVAAVSKPGMTVLAPGIGGVGRQRDLSTRAGAGRGRGAYAGDACRLAGDRRARRKPKCRPGDAELRDVIQAGAIQSASDRHRDGSAQRGERLGRMRTSCHPIRLGLRWGRHVVVGDTRGQMKVICLTAANF